MKRQFSLATIFRMTEKSLMRRFFESFGVQTDNVCWDEVNRRNITLLEKIFDEIQQTTTRDQMEIILRRIHSLACDKGMDALNEVAEFQAGKSWNKDLLLGKNLYSRSLTAWLDYREIFEEAIKYFDADFRTWWRKRIDLPQIIPNTTQSTIDNMEEEIELLLKTTQGRGYSCTIETLSRPNGQFYFFAHPDDYVRDSFVHDEDDQLVHQTIRPTFEVVFAYDSFNGNSELSARLPQRIKESLEAIFLRHTLGIEPEKEEEKPFDLSMLLDRNFELTVNPEDRIKVCITSLTLKSADRFTICTSTRYPKSACEMAFQMLRPELFTCPDVSVSRVRFRFEFLSADGGRSRFLTFEIAAPFHCTLKNQYPELEEIIHQHLIKWGIEHDTHENVAFAGNDQDTAFINTRKRTPSPDTPVAPTLEYPGHA